LKPTPTSRPKSFRARAWRKALGLGAIAFALLNVFAYRHAYSMTHFSATGVRTGRPETLTLLQKLRVGAAGVELPKPRNEATPLDRGMPFETWTIPLEPKVSLEAWSVLAVEPRGVVVLFHGYADRKSSILAEARAFLDQGWSPVLVDLRGSGGSSGEVTSIGYHEGKDVEASARFVRARAGGAPVVVWGVSMGAAASLRAVGKLGVAVDGLIVEAPFATMRSAVVNRFNSLGVPSFGLADLLVFWGGRQHSFDGFAHNPVDYARGVSAPTLLLLGSRDERVLMPEGRAIFEALPASKQFEVFDGLGHQSLLRGNPDQWTRVVGAFLAQIGT
jgi:alpha-beta hydrolase superfamily lysophospholipase